MMGDGQIHLQTGTTTAHIGGQQGQRILSFAAIKDPEVSISVYSDTIGCLATVQLAAGAVPIGGHVLITNSRLCLQQCQ
jgi:hypothetical protein